MQERHIEKSHDLTIFVPFETLTTIQLYARYTYVILYKIFYIDILRIEH